ncbi:MAG: hypothetical protein AAFX06_09470 [Planctomycetota bacterium]
MLAPLGPVNSQVLPLTKSSGSTPNSTTRLGVFGRLGRWQVAPTVGQIQPKLRAQKEFGATAAYESHAAVVKIGNLRLLFGN